MKPLENKPTKICPCCKVKKDLEIGFDKDSSSSSGYHSWCKICKGNAQKERKHKKKDYIFERHLWGKEDEKNRESVCLRCGLIRKRIPDKWRHTPDRSQLSWNHHPGRGQGWHHARFHSSEGCGWNRITIRHPYL